MAQSEDNKTGRSSIINDTNPTAPHVLSPSEDDGTIFAPEAPKQHERADVHEKTLQTDIYSFGISYAYKYKKLPIDLCACMCMIFVIQVFGVLSIVWSSTVRTSTDVVLRFDTYDIGLCYNSTGLYYNRECEAPIFDFNRKPENEDSYPTFEVYLQEGDGQFDSIVAEADDPQINWDYFALGYITITVISLSILSIKVVNAAMCPLSIITISYHAADDWTNRRLLKYMMRFTGLLHLSLVLFAWGVGYRDIAFYIPKYGLGNPADVILGPISLIFILEIDHWVVDIVRLRYAPADYTFKVSPQFEKQYNSVVFSFTVFFNACFFGLIIALMYTKWNLFSDADSDAQQTWIYVFVGFAVFVGGTIFSSVPFCCVRLSTKLRLYQAIRM